MEKLKAGLCSKTISKDLDIVGSNVQLSARLIMWSMGEEDLREYVKTANLPRHACPPKATGWTRRALIRETAAEIHSSTGRIY